MSKSIWFFKKKYFKYFTVDINFKCFISTKWQKFVIVETRTIIKCIVNLTLPNEIINQKLNFYINTIDLKIRYVKVYNLFCMHLSM